MTRKSVPVKTNCPTCGKVVQLSSSDLLRNPDMIVSCPACEEEFPFSLRSRKMPTPAGKEQPLTAKFRPASPPLDEPEPVEPLDEAPDRLDPEPPRRPRRAPVAPDDEEDLPLPVSPKSSPGKWKADQEAPPFVTLGSDSSVSHSESQSLPPFAPSVAGRSGPDAKATPPSIPSAPTFAAVGRPRRSVKDWWNARSSGQQTWLVAGPLIVLAGVIVFFLPFGESPAAPQKARSAGTENNKTQPEPNPAPAPEKQDGPNGVPLLLEDPPASGEKQPATREKGPSAPKEVPAPKPGISPKPAAEDLPPVPPPR
jgi:hypothetical protein